MIKVFVLKLNSLLFHITENPVLCDDNLPELVASMEMQQARLLGIAHCIVPQQIVDSSVIMEPPMILQRMMKPQAIAVAPNLLQPLQPPPSIVQIIVPASAVQAIVNQPQETSNNTIEPSNETIDIDAENKTEVDDPVEESVVELTSSTTAAAPIEMPAEPEKQEELFNESEQNETHVVPEDEEPVDANETVKEEEVVNEKHEEEELKVEVDHPSSTTTSTLPPDVIGNVIHEVYSPIPEVLSPIDAQALSAEPEAPPEVLLDTPEDTEP